MSQASGHGEVSHLFTRSRAVLAALFVAAVALGGCEGPAGPAGADGSNGAACTLTDNGDGTSTITCPGGTSITVPTGAKGTTCTIQDNPDGTRTIKCSDGTSVVVTDAVLDYTAMTLDELKASSMTAEITSVAIPADGHPVVKIKVRERHGLGVKGLAAEQTNPPSSLLPISWRFALLKLDTGVNGSANETWVSYMASNATSTAGTETATNAGLIDNGDGTYTYTFTRAVTGPAGTSYEPGKPHRLVILMAASGNPFSPINLVEDFVPSTGADVTGQHEKFDGGACLECHTTFRAIADGTGAFGSGEFHSGGRYDTRTCIACHNDQRRFTTLSSTTKPPTVGDAAIAADGTWTGRLAVVNGEGVLDLPVFLHKIHMGEKLKLTGGAGGTYVGVPEPFEVTYPQDIRNCTKCHRNPPTAKIPVLMADNWKTQPSRRACGACHDDKSFVNPPPAGRTLHSGGPMADDSKCLLCHGPGGIGGSPADVHAPVSPPNPNNIYVNPTSGNSNTNAAWVAAAGFVPPTAKVLTYAVKSVRLDPARHPQISFLVKRADPTATPPVAPTPVVFQTAGSASEMIPGFVGSPSAYFVYAVPQDGITAPADFNASASGYLRNIWNGTATGGGAGTLVGPDADGYYTVTLTGVVIPTNAGMLTGGIGYTYSLGSATPSTGAAFSDNTQPFTEIDLTSRYPYTPNASGFGGTGGLIVPPPDVAMTDDSPDDKFTARRFGSTAGKGIVLTAKCNACHVSLGVGPDFHAGQRNDAPTCSFCHNPNRSSSGWSANAKDFIHSIHAAEKRLVKFNWHAESPTEGFFNVTYPAILNRCEMCHDAGTYDFSSAESIAALPNMLPSTAGQGRFNNSPVTNPSGYFSISSYIPVQDNTVDYGFGFATSNVTARLPDGLGGTQNKAGTIISCSVTSPCICTAANPCSVDISAPYTVNNVAVTFTQGTGASKITCSAATPCTCTTAATCSGVVATCSPGTPCQAQPTTLVTSPIAAACVACHDAPSAVDHMQTNGASIWEPRSIALTKPQKEECLVCHGPNRIANIALVHTDKTP